MLDQEQRFECAVRPTPATRRGECVGRRRASPKLRPSIDTAEYEMRSKLGRRKYLVHLEQPAVHLCPVLDAGRDGVQLRGVFVERAAFEFMYPRDRDEIQVRRR